MEINIIAYGICNKTFYAIEAIDNYYSLWFIDSIPTDMTPNEIENFIQENCLDGGSVSGTYKAVMKELADLITDLH